MMDQRQDAGPRLDEVESRLAFQEELSESLNRVVARQDLELADLARRLRALEGRLNDLAETAGAGGSDVGHEVPPHY